MMCYSCRKYDGCELPWKCSSTMYDCSAYELEQTNEEWLKQANTEQLAEAIYYLTWFHTELDERLDKNVKNGCYNDDENIKIVMEWLKQPHRKGVTE